MSKMTAERIIEEVLHPFPERVWLSHRIVARLRAAGLLVGDPREPSAHAKPVDTSPGDAKKSQAFLYESTGARDD